MNPDQVKLLDEYRKELRDVYSQIPVEKIYLNSRSEMPFNFMDPDKKLRSVSLDPMTSSVIISAIVPKSAVLFKGGHGGGKTTMIEEVSSRLFDVSRDEIVAAMIRGNDDQNVNTLLASYDMGKLITGKGEDVKWRKFVTCPVKIADEINRFPPTAQNALFEIFNKGRVEFANEVYDIKQFELFATMNPNDPGTYPMSRPFLDRFGLCIPVPQMPSAEDLMSLSSRKDDKIYKHEIPEKRLTLDKSMEMEKIIADNVKLSPDALLYSIYLGQSLSSCIRGDFGDKSHSELGLEERCQGCEFSTPESLCRKSQDGFSGRAFLDMQRWAKGYSFFLNAFEDSSNPEVQLGILEGIVPYVLYHRLTPNNSFFTKDPYHGRQLTYLKDIASKARQAYLMVKGPLLEIPDILAGRIDPKKAQINSVKKDLVVLTHFKPIVDAVAMPDFRATYDAIEGNDHITKEDVVSLNNTLTFNTELPPRARAFLREKAYNKSKGGQSL